MEHFIIPFTFAIAIWVYLDCKKITEDKSMANKYAILVALFLPIALPYYLIKRKEIVRNVEFLKKK